MSIRVGDRLPEATFRCMTPEGPSTITTGEVFGGRKVVLFAVPGAFTPTCSRQHLPSYLKHYEAIKASGVDTIACVAVNDVFVLDAWARQHEVGDRVLMLSDGNGDFARQIGLELDDRKYGMGIRLQRFAMVVDDGVVTQLNVEAPGEFRVSSAEYTCQL